MARPLRIEFPGAVYHITSRGNAKANIFDDELDRKEFLKTFSSVVKRYNWICHAYCLMDNHYHLMIETPEANLSGGMRQLNGVYTQSYNYRHRRVGHIFQGRFSAILIQKESYLLEASRYVVLNPVRAGIVSKPGEWSWSSYAATVGIRKKPEFLTTEWVLKNFHGDRVKAVREYKKFVSDSFKDSEVKMDLKEKAILGGKEFINSFRDRLRKAEPIKEIPKRERYSGRKELNEIFRQVSEKKIRDQKICKAYFEYGYTMREISEYLEIHYTTVSKVLKAGENLYFKT